MIDCRHLSLWLLDVWLIHNAFLSAINRLWEFRHTHTHTTPKQQVTWQSHQLCLWLSSILTCHCRVCCCGTFSLVRSSWEKHLVAQGVRDKKYRETPEQQSSQSDTSCLTSIYEKRSTDCRFCSFFLNKINLNCYFICFLVIRVDK